MTPKQKEAALRLADYWSADDWPAGLSGLQMDETAALLRELVAEADDFHMQYRMKCDEETKALRVANTKLVGAIDLIREALNGGEVQDLHQIINTALAEYRAAQKPSGAQQLGADIWSGLYGN